MKQVDCFKKVIHFKWWIVSTMSLLAIVVVFISLFKIKSPVVHQRLLPFARLTIVNLAKDLPTLLAIGTVKAAKGVRVSAASSGIIASINFQSGQRIQVGKSWLF